MQNYTFSSEAQFNTPEQNTFWQQVTQATLLTQDNISLAYAYIRHPNNNKAVVISNGRVESYLKYQELMYDLYQQGYSVYTLDHRGQGLSQRQTHNPHQGFVKRFEDYVVDLSDFIKQIVLGQQHQQLNLLAHSMGSTVATLLLAQQPHWFNCAVFSSPMFGIKLPLNANFILWLAKLLDSCQLKEGLYQCNYVLGGKDYSPIKFESNHLSHSRKRYYRFRELFTEYPKIQLGAPTNHWLLEAIEAAEQCVNLSRSITTPRLILQAEQEKIVCNQAQNRSLNQYCQKVVIKNAYHEMFIESDSARNQALTAMFDFFTSHSTTTEI
ncbi:alpha/beta fold hydrolase [Shewanella intestini]|uniref:Alpha/beta fold hydrolase n=1 Tax=Shewanella intestini TaxID=2017544 RepID=A0ABS5I5J2_9GAMM|nr:MULTISPECIES: alpha/beta fold hydrolase [Shewanella]MBR9729293.1 alpha/beta fold hydrolase [Shewanella intestini]MRG37372.1 alpha/beta fold hydrolase [Shewanella sp. XMDDZSB0408]